MKNDLKKNIVLGSGLSAMTAAAKLLKKNQIVYVYDVGIEPEKKSIEIKNNLRNNNKYFDALTDILKISRKNYNLNNKFHFGSSFAYSSKKEIFNSYSKGGLTNIWGANILPYNQMDIKNWIIANSDLVKNYNFISDIINVKSIENNSLNEKFNYSYKNKYSEKREGIRDDQTNKILNELNSIKEILYKENIFFGETNIALDDQNNCTKCGFCFYGCPHDVIFNSQKTLNQLNNNENFHYNSNYKVINFRESDNNVVLKIYNYTNKKHFFEKCDKLFLTNGSFNILELLFNSQIINEQVNIKQSQQFIFFGKIKNYKEKIDHKINTMAKINLEMLMNTISKKFIHIQIYPMSDVILFESFYRLNFFKKIFQKLLFLIFKKYFICIGYLPSEISSSINLSPKNKIRKNQNLNEKKNISLIIKKLNDMLKKTNLKFLNLVKLMKINASFHVGAAFPMSKNKLNNESDDLGRIKKMQNVHILDPLILPEICSTTTTLTSLSNNLRIIDKIYPDE